MKKEYGKVIGKVIGSIFGVVIVLSLYSRIALAETPGAFAQHQKQFSLIAGNARAFGEDYFVVGLGVNYFVLDGLALGMNAETWSGGEPRINKITPSVQYVVYQIPGVKPYVGGFYRKVYIESSDDLESSGGRAGAYFRSGSNAYMGAGIVYEKYSDCDERFFRECSETYPEVMISVAF